MSRKMSFLCAATLLLVFNVAFASEVSNIDEMKSAFRSFSDVTVPAIIVPTVIEMPFELRDNIMDTAMLVEKQSQKRQAVLVLDKKVVMKNNLRVADSIGSNTAIFLVDGEIESFVEYPVSSDGNVQNVTISISSNQAITSTSVSFYLDRFVSLPKEIEVTAMISGEERIVLAKKDVSSATINFPKTTAQEFRIKLSYVQPLRIRELSLNQENLDIARESSVRFLAQPGISYELYWDADRFVEAYEGEMPNLRDNNEVMVIKKNVSTENSFYRKSDVDGDGVADELDNCVTTKNPEQEDINNNDQGDACDDFDRDGVINAKDNCRDLPNRDQKDTDLDGIGNACDDKENRILQNQKWLPLALIILVAGIIGMFFWKTMKTEQIK